MTSTRTVRRTLLAAAALVAAFTIPAAAQQAPPPGPQGPGPAAVVRSGITGSPTDQVASFYGAYIDAVHDSSRSRLTGELRKHYLTGRLQQRLAIWEHRSHADGVLRAQNVPTAWAVKYDKSDAGHVWSLVRLTWGSGAQRTFSYLSVQSDFAAKRISDITSIPHPAIGTGAQPHDQQRPGEQHRPGAGPDSRPGQASRPGQDSRPGQASRPGQDSRPATGYGPGQDSKPSADHPTKG